MHTVCPWIVFEIKLGSWKIIWKSLIALAAKYIRSIDFDLVVYATKSLKIKI